MRVEDGTEESGDDAFLPGFYPSVEPPEEAGLLSDQALREEAGTLAALSNAKQQLAINHQFRAPAAMQGTCLEGHRTAAGLTPGVDGHVRAGMTPAPSPLGAKSTGLEHAALLLSRAIRQPLTWRANDAAGFACAGQSRLATMSISTRAPLAKPDTPTQVRAGRRPGGK